MNPNRSQQVGKLAPWAKGRARNTPTDDWPQLRRRLTRVLRRPVHKKISRYMLAAYCQCSERSVRRWLAGIHNPSPQFVTAMQRWLDRITDKQSTAR